MDFDGIGSFSMRNLNVSAREGKTTRMKPSISAMNGHAKKHFGVVYTPDVIVALMLDKLPSLKDVAICDPSCGDGQFLVAIAERVYEKMRSCRSEASREAYRATLKKLTGFDIDREALKDCRRRLNAVARKHGCRSMKWNLQLADAIDRETWKDMTEIFDCVVGNPPYVRIQHLEAYRRKQINQGQWRLMSGCSDLFILFFEMGLKLLKKHGHLVFITPNSWMKTESGRALRQCLRERHEICSIADFGEHQVFEYATTYTAITEIRKGGKSKHVTSASKCVGFVDGTPVFANGQVDTKEKDCWTVLSVRERRFINKIRASSRRLSDVAHINVGIQTLADNVFIINAGEQEQISLKHMQIDIEPEVTRRIYKASVMKGGKDVVDRIVIYPYRNGKLLPENELREKYPKAHAYLLRHKKRLLARDKGAIDPKRWYGYGREVAIVSGFGEKILTSAMNPMPNFGIYMQCSP